MSVITEYDSLLLDLDGTVYEGGRAIEHAVSSINSSGLPLMYVTNNASRAPEVVAEQLRDIGLDQTTAEHVMTSAQAACQMAAEKIPVGSRVYVLGTESFRDLARNAGFEVVDSADDQPQAVLHGHNPETGWAQLSEAALAINAGAQYFASNLDSTLPMERGRHIGNGSMVAAVTHATGVTPLSAGKPGPAMFYAAAAALNSTKPLAVGDRLDTDIAGGNAAGMDTFQVLTGVSGFYDLVYAVPEQRPTYIAASLQDLYSEPGSLRPGSQGGFKALIDGATLVISGGDSSAGPTPIAALRTALEKAWASTSPITDVRADSELAAQALKNWW
ncbi:HAD family sugar phosphatase [Corynebacterium suranareeae]|uniref:HAD family sugar phosphatase n=1 Tax=Corynebacterium suranareeae TaxID=2506452 RepID=A0A160PQK2_9CORY|nr:HAD-IIA family hydrolase [Corynebacterium suranareeae]BAU95765.1 HAD family sugar phosphatase [Corynebacterium suranareeae]